MSNRAEFEKWMEIQEIIGPAKKWPFNVRRLFWKRNLTNFERGVIAAFVQVNALNPDILREWMEMKNPNDAQKVLKIIDYFKMGKYTYMYGYHVANTRYVNYNVHHARKLI